MKAYVYFILALILSFLQVNFGINVIGIQDAKAEIKETLDVNRFKLPSGNLKIIENSESSERDYFAVTIKNSRKKYDKYIKYLDDLLRDCNYIKEENKYGFEYLNVYTLSEYDKETTFTFYYNPVNKEYDLSILCIKAPKDEEVDSVYFEERRETPAFILSSALNTFTNENINFNNLVSTYKDLIITQGENSKGLSFKFKLDGKEYYSIDETVFNELALTLQESLSPKYTFSQSAPSGNYNAKYTKLECTDDGNFLTNINLSYSVYMFKDENNLYKKDYYFSLEYECELIEETNAWPIDSINKDVFKSKVGIDNYEGKYAYSLVNYDGVYNKLQLEMFAYNSDELKNWCNTLKNKGFSEEDNIYIKTIIFDEDSNNLKAYAAKIALDEHDEYVLITFSTEYLESTTYLERLKKNIKDNLGEDILAYIPFVDTEKIESSVKDGLVYINVKGDSNFLKSFKKELDRKDYYFSGSNTYYYSLSSNKRIIITITNSKLDNTEITIQVKND